MQPTYTILGADGQSYGPVTLDQLKTWIQEGRVASDTQISRSDYQGWLPASQFTELGLAAAAAAAPVATAVATAPAMPSRPVIANAQTEDLEKRIRGGASWFYWIAALSLVNSVIALFGSETGFIIGLGVTRVIDAFGQAMGGAGKAVALGLDVVVLAVFVAFGIFANKKHLWAFIVGMILYGLDALIYVLVQEWLCVGFHVFAFFGIFAGFRGALEYRKLQS